MSLFRFVAGNTQKAAMRVSKRIMDGGSLPVINYAVENAGKKYKTFKEYETLYNKLDFDCKVALKLSSIDYDYDLANDLVDMFKVKHVKLLLDSEDSEHNELYNNMVNTLLNKHNQLNINVVKTYPMYRRDSLETLQKDLKYCKQKGTLLGTKLVRGAYWNAEHEQGDLYENKYETDMNYNTGILTLYNELIMNDGINLYNMLATHNVESINLGLLLNGFSNRQIFEFCNLLGMQNKKYKQIAKKSDQVANVYIPYGPFRQMMPYLMRRLYENIDQLKYCI